MTIYFMSLLSCYFKVTSKTMSIETHNMFIFIIIYYTHVLKNNHIIFENVCEINYAKYDHICLYMLIFLCVILISYNFLSHRLDVAYIAMWECQ